MGRKRSGAVLAEPVNIQALLQAQAGPMQLDIEVGRRQREFLTDFLRRKLQPFAHQKQPAQRGRQTLHAGVQHLEELHLLQGLVRVAPVIGRLGKVAVGPERQPVQLVALFVSLRIHHSHRACIAAKQVDHLVLEDADQPGFELRAIAEALRL